MNYASTALLLATAAYSGSVYFYIKDVYLKKITPNIASFMISGLISVPFLITLLEKEIYSSVPFVVVGITSAVFTCLIAIKNNKFYFKKIDKVILFIGMLGVIARILTNNSSVSIYVSATVDVLFFVPIIAKLSHNHQLETLTPWLLNLAGALFTIFAISSWRLEVVIVPIIQLAGSATLNYMLLRSYGTKPVV